jgi:hypothetical protein
MNEMNVRSNTHETLIGNNRRRLGIRLPCSDIAVALALRFGYYMKEGVQDWRLLGIRRKTVVANMYDMAEEYSVLLGPVNNENYDVRNSSLFVNLVLAHDSHPSFFIYPFLACFVPSSVHDGNCSAHIFESLF